MKTRPCVHPAIILFATLWLAVSPPVRAADLCLSAECTSNKLMLRWDGAAGATLQQATDLAHPIWQDVPVSAGTNACEIPMTNAMAFFRLVSTGAALDGDGDGLDEFTETNGWFIVVDSAGYGDPGLVERRFVTSDPALADSDGDGLSDFWEWLIGTDPRNADTDGDGLSDGQEWFRWHSSPTSVDTDGDARGPSHNLPPRAQLFDGNELSLLHTSPTLEDTDGDGRTDYEEYDQPGRSPLVAEVPRLGVELVDAVDVRLDVAYAEEAGTEHQYGGELSISDSTRMQYSTEASLNWQVSVGAQLDFVGPFPEGGSVNTEVSVGGEFTVGFEAETSHTVEQSHSDYLTDSRTRTETAASGSMSGGIRLINTGPVTYTITDLGMTVRYMQPGAGNGGEPALQTLATLIPALGVNGITLAPGDRTPVLQVSATDLNVSRIKQFLARPNSLYLEPAFYELENATGLNFDYLEEVTRWRTARVLIDYGNGTSEEYRVATAVDRNTDGTYAGVTLSNVLGSVLQIPFQTVPRRTLQTNSPTNERVLFSVRNVAAASPTNGFWAVVLSAQGALPAHVDFEKLVLQASDEVLLVFVRDDDGDGLFAAEEQHYRTDDSTSGDSDGDGLADVFEVRTGWDVVLPARTYHVYSDPSQANQDGDGLTDLQELQQGTDPTKPDTDEDGLPDNVDPHPLVSAKVLRVKADAVHGGNSPTNGLTWDAAFTNLQDALSLARSGAATPGADDDVAEIWVAGGIYKPTTDTTNRAARFELVNNTALYGGFSGVETKQSQRNRDPLSNDTILSGDLLGNDTSTPWDDPTTYNDNSHTVCFASTGVGAGTIFDGFTITGGNAIENSYGGGLFSYGRPQIRNLFFRANYGVNGAGLWIWLPVATTEPYVISDCLFLQNGAGTGGAGGMLCQGQIYAEPLQSFIITNCQFYENVGTGDGGGLAVGQGAFLVENCTFAWNVTSGRGGGINVLRPASARISNCEFLGNTAANGGSALYLADFLYQAGGLKTEVLQSVFWGNLTAAGYGVISAQGNDASKRLYVLNSTFVSNVTASASGTVNVTNGAVWIENSILWGNTKGVTGSGVTRTVRTTCLPDASAYLGAGNINADPKFIDSFGGNLRLQSGSPCIDAGNNYVDYFPTVPGFQPLPARDLDGNWRVLDGNGDGSKKVDMGAYENLGL